MSLVPGLSAEFSFDVGSSDTAVAVGSGDLAVLGTPRVVALFEQATVRALVDELPAGRTSVGVEVVVQHRRPSLPGARIEVAAQLTEVEGDRLVFDVVAHSLGEVVADGVVRRVLVDRERFLRRAGAHA